MRGQKPELVTAPATALLSLSETKEFLRIDGDDDDALLASLIGAATAKLDGYQGLVGRALITQTWRQHFDDFPVGNRLALAFGPAQSVASLSYKDQTGGSASFASFHLVDEPIGPVIALEDGASWPSTATRPDAVTVEWVAGFGDAPSDVPESVRLAGLQLIAHWYANREAVSVGVSVAELPWAVTQTITAFRAFGG
ncbi:MAG: head-tail connector protein [Pseudomonadota bacterium]